MFTDKKRLEPDELRTRDPLKKIGVGRNGRCPV